MRAFDIEFPLNTPIAIPSPSEIGLRNLLPAEHFQVIASNERMTIKQIKRECHKLKLPDLDNSIWEKVGNFLSNYYVERDEPNLMMKIHRLVWWRKTNLFGDERSCFLTSVRPMVVPSLVKLHGAFFATWWMGNNPIGRSILLPTDRPEADPYSYWADKPALYVFNTYSTKEGYYSEDNDYDFTNRDAAYAIAAYVNGKAYRCQGQFDEDQAPPEFYLNSDIVWIVTTGDVTPECVEQINFCTSTSNAIDDFYPFFKEDEIAPVCRSCGSGIEKWDSLCTACGYKNSLTACRDMLPTVEIRINLKQDFNFFLDIDINGNLIKRSVSSKYAYRIISEDTVLMYRNSDQILSYFDHHWVSRFDTTDNPSHYVVQWSDELQMFVRKYRDTFITNLKRHCFTHNDFVSPNSMNKNVFDQQYFYSDIDNLVAQFSANMSNINFSRRVAARFVDSETSKAYLINDFNLYEIVQENSNNIFFVRCTLSGDFYEVINGSFHLQAKVFSGRYVPYNKITHCSVVDLNTHKVTNVLAPIITDMQDDDWSFLYYNRLLPVDSLWLFKYMKYLLKHNRAKTTDFYYRWSGTFSNDPETRVTWCFPDYIDDIIYLRIGKYSIPMPRALFRWQPLVDDSCENGPSVEIEWYPFSPKPYTTLRRRYDIYPKDNFRFNMNLLDRYLISGHTTVIVHSDLEDNVHFDIVLYDWYNNKLVFNFYYDDEDRQWKLRNLPNRG